MPSRSRWHEVSRAKCNDTSKSLRAAHFAIFSAQHVLIQVTRRAVAMDVFHVARDQIALYYEQPQREALYVELEDLGHNARIATPGKAQPANEKTPLVLKAGLERVEIDADVDLSKLTYLGRGGWTGPMSVDNSVFLSKAKTTALFSSTITLTLLLEIVPRVVVAMMIGSIAGANSPRVLAAVSLSEFFLGQVTHNAAYGLGTAVATMCSHTFAAKQYDRMWVYVQAGLLACIYGFVPVALLCLNGSKILHLAGQDDELADIAGKLILIGAAALPFLMLFTITRGLLQAQSLPVPYLRTSVISTVISLPVGYALGHYTSLGYIGIALATLISHVIKAVMCVPILLKSELRVSSWPGWQWREAHNRVRVLLRVGASSVLLVSFQSIGFAVIPFLCGYLPNAVTVMAANSIASTQLLLMVFIPMIAVSGASTILVGDEMSNDQDSLAVVVCLVAVIVMAIVGIVGMLATWLSAGLFAKLFTSDAATIELASQLITKFLLLIPFAGIAFAAQSLYQACGAQWLSARIRFVFLFVIGAPLGLVLAISRNGGVFGLWNGYIAGTFACVVAAAVFLNYLDWRPAASEAYKNAHLHVEGEPASKPAPSDATAIGVLGAKA